MVLGLWDGFPLIMDGFALAYLAGAFTTGSGIKAMAGSLWRNVYPFAFCFSGRG